MKLPIALRPHRLLFVIPAEALLLYHLLQYLLLFLHVPHYFLLVMELPIALRHHRLLFVIHVVYLLAYLLPQYLLR
ncbi:unnamed protein product [Meloidogyne enterolobii]|uniref:Uncharacterized protein n=1 Tax=Meloidogyne enterolobii TaxID=390850 RepID=A0ACB0ZIA7_MELEN